MIIFLKKAWNFIATYWKIGLAIIAFILVGVIVLISMGKLGAANKVIQDLRNMIMSSISSLKEKNKQLAKEAEEIDKKIQADKERIRKEEPLVQPNLPKSDKEMEDAFNNIGKKP